ncbi:hypothetical protein VUJ46_05560 [Chryseobacterium sp. MYb264]|uniref:hypothetical protein n=1 Tax=Chryseobacterium sp. MYb264 TaxID=2745153 RepID=UPI002E15FC3F|nr:hypothetical protein VUJ46_05560 [Chryseobacterium sp. MYb264]
MKRAIVVGATSGIGKEPAEIMATNARIFYSPQMIQVLQMILSLLVFRKDAKIFFNTLCF